MRALVCREYGPIDSLVVAEVAAPSPGPGQLLVDVLACGLAFPDVLVVQDLYQFKPKPPFTPGNEVAGVVRAVGEGVEGFAPGDRVFGSTAGWGGLAEQALMDVTKTFRTPDGVDPVAAAGFLLNYRTSLHALRDRGELQPGERLLVLGAAGGVGLAAVELGVLLGAEVIAAASTEEKLALCRARGAAATVNYETEDLKARVRDLTGGHGADVVYDPVGGRYSEPALRATAWRGRFLVVGFAAGDIPRIPLNLALLKGCSVVGVFYGDFAVREPEEAAAIDDDLVHWLADGTLQPHVSAVLPLDRAVEGLHLLADRKAEGKVIVTP